MKNPKRNPVERFCALLLAFIMVFTLVLPDGALSVSAAGNNSDEASGEPEASTEKTTDVEFTIFEKVPTTENPDNKVAIQGADLQIKEAGTDNVVANGQSDGNGKVKVENLTYDTEKSYEYTVSKAGYQALENKSVSIGTVNEVEVTLEMSDISLGDLSAVELSPNKEGVPSQVQAVINNKIDNFEVGGAAQYKWESSNPAVADVDGNGLITAKGRGSATITVSRNGKSAQTTIKVKEVPSMELNVTPDNGTDVKSVTAKASLPTDAAGGTVTFSVNGADNIVNVAADGTAELILNGAVMGTLNISAVYSGNELYYEASASTNGSYKQSKDISLKDTKGNSNTTITYGVNEVPALSVFDAEDRVVTFSSDDPKVIEATPEGKLTVKGAGTAKITATAAESDNYIKASASYNIIVSQKPIGEITFDDFEWNTTSASKVYDRSKKISITGTLKSDKLVGNDQITVTVNAQLKKEDVGNYSEFTVTDADSDINLKGANNYKITTDFSNKNVQLAEGKTVNITPRPVYVKVAVKEGKTTKFAYGTIKADLQKAVEENYEVVLAGKYEDGNILEPDKEQGLLSPAKLELKNYAKVALKGFNDNDTVYYVGSYTAEVIPVITNKNAGNYEIRVDSENIAKYSSDLTIEKEKETQASLNDLVEIVGADGIYRNEKDGSVYIRGNQAATLKLNFKETNAYYDQIWVSKGEKQADGQEIYYDAINSGISFDDSKDKEYTLKVSLRNSKNAETVTDGVEYQKITVDATSPTADFKDLGNAGQFNKVLPNDWKGFGNFSKDKIKKYLVTSDDATSKVKSLKTCKITVDNDEAEAIVEKISEAVKNDSVWEEKDSVQFNKEGNYSVQFNKEGNYIVLALVEDNVGNKAVYASNGLVFDLTKPTVTIKVDDVKEEEGPDGTVKFKVEVNDTNITSGIDTVEIKTFDANQEVSSEKVNSADVVGSWDSSLESIKKHSQFSIERTLNINEYSSGKAKIQVIASDKARNKSDLVSETVKVDVIKPEVNVSYDSTSSSEYIKSNTRTMTITYTERNFIEDGLTFDVSIDGVENKNVKLANIDSRITVDKTSEKADEHVYTLTFKGDGAYKVIPKITDAAGNTNIKDGSDGKEEDVIVEYSDKNSGANKWFILDDTLPKIEVSYDKDSENDSEYVKDSESTSDKDSKRVMTITYTERNFTPKGLTFNVSINGEKKEGISLEELEKIDTEHIKVAGPKDSQKDVKELENYRNDRTNEYTITFIGDGAYQVTPYIKDAAENTNDGVTYADSESKANELFVLDSTAPEVTITYNDDNNDVKVHNGKYFNHKRSATVSIEERNFDSKNLGFTLIRDNKSVTYDSFEDLKTAVNKWNDCSIEEEVIIDNQKDKTKETYNNKRTHTFKIEFGQENVDHDYKISITTTDLAGNSNSSVTDKNIGNETVATGEEFTVDMLAPTLTVQYYVYQDKNGNELDEEHKEPITEEINSGDCYKNASIHAEVIIDERNFSEEKNGKDSFVENQMNLKCSAEEYNGTKIDISTKFSDIAKERENWKPNQENRKDNIETLNLEFSEDANYTLSITYEDLAGNSIYPMSYKSQFTVDKTAPTGEIQIGEDKKDVGIIGKVFDFIYSFFTNNETEITMVGTDTISPIVEQKYYIEKDRDIKNGNTGYGRLRLEELKSSSIVWSDKETIIEKNESTSKFKISEENSKAIPYLYIKDKAGNETYVTSDGAIYDGEEAGKPNIQITTKKDNLISLEGENKDIGLFNGNVTFNIEVTDPIVNDTYSGINNVSYRIYKNGESEDVKYISLYNETMEKPIMKQSFNTKNDFEGKLEVSSKDFNSNDVTIEVTATDNAGNTETVTKQIAIDTTPPEITVSYNNNTVANGKYFKADRTMTIEYKERNFDEKGLTFDVSTNGSLLQGISLDELKKLKDKGIIVQQFTAADDDTESGKSFKDFTDKRVNTYKILFNAGGNNGDMDYYIVPHIIDKANNKQNKETQYKAGTEAKTEFTIDKKAPVISMAYSAEGETINPGGNEVSRVYRNKTITATATIEERNFSNSNSFSEDPKQMNLTYDALNFQGSKVNTENYTGTANTRGEWSTNVYTRTKTFTFSQDANYTLGLVYRDLAGNEAVYDTRYFTVDKTAPTGSMTIEDNSGTAKTWIQWIQQVFFDIFTQSQKGVSMTSADETAGVASTQYYKYHPDSESRHTFDGLSTQNLDSISSWSDGYSTSVNADEQVIVYEKITDRAGNVTYINNQEGVIADNTSPTAPEIKITAAEPAQGIYNASVPFTIDVTDPENGGTYAGLKEVSYEITNNGKVTQSGNYNSDLSDPTARVHNIHRSETVNAELNNSNHVTIKVKAVDYAGNQSEATKDLKIDITHPEVTITFDLNNPLNGKYYKTTRTATISVKERNFDTNAVDLKITNTDGTMPSVSGWSISSQAGESDDAINTCRVEFSADGDYNMTMQCKDQAGNESNTVKVDEFTIDKTIPVISVSYDNNSAATPGYYNANRTATITIKEHNFNAAEVNSQITAALQGSGISAPGVGGWSNSGDTHTASVTFSDDGDYTFDIDYTDLAGNAAADYTQDSFTVDKTKPEVEFFDIEDKSANNGVVAPGVKYSDVNYLESGVEIKIEGAEHESKELTGSRSSIANGESIKMNDFEYTQDNDDVYTMTAVISDKAGNKTEKKIMFSVNRFGSNYSFSDTTKEFLDEVYSNSAKDLVITETNVDSLVFNGISYSLDNKTTELKQGTDYTVKETGGEGSWKQYTYTIKKENFEKEGRYSVTIDSEDKATNTMNNKVKERNINFVIDKTPPTVVITGIEESSYRADSRDMSVNVSDNTAVKRLDIMVDGKSVATYSQEDVKEAGGKIVYTLNSSNSKQKVKAVAVDMADNEANSDNHNILITTNLFIQYINNKPLFIGSIIALVLIAGGAIYFFVFRRKKSEDAADAN